jgi:hypothetical protein
VRRADRGQERGQGLVEFASLVPVFLLLLLGMLEFGFVFDQNLTLEYATREGARVGAALANGGGVLGCGAGQSPNAATVDPQVMAAVRRVLLSPSSRVVPATSPAMVVTIWKANAAGQPVGGFVNTWTYTGPGTGPLVDGQNIGFTQGTVGWNACARTNGGVGGPDSIGVSLTHVYKFQTALAGILGFFGGPTANQLPISDRTVMALNPTD